MSALAHAHARNWPPHTQKHQSSRHSEYPTPHYWCLVHVAWLFSKPYCIAMGLAVVEYCIEAWLLPAFKGPQVIGNCHRGALQGGGQQHSSDVGDSLCLCLNHRTKYALTAVVMGSGPLCC